MTWMRVIDYYASHYKYTRAVLLAAGLILLTVIAYFAYSSYRQAQVEKAHAQLAWAIEQFERVDQEGTGQWQEVEQALENGYKQFAGTSLAPFFVAFQAEVALRQGNVEKARELQTKAVHDLTCSSPFYMPYAIKLARMQLDAGQPEGAQSLQKLVENATAPGRDMALYYQGLIPFEKGDRAAAEKIWDTLISTYGQESVWAQLAQAKLDYAV